MLSKGNRIVAQDVIEAIGTGGGNGGGLETGDIGIASFPIDENQGRRVYLNGQIIAQGKFEDFTVQLKEAVQKYPNMVCTEEEWQNIAAQDEDGQVGKFVIDDVAGTIRLPRIIKLQGTLNFTEVGDLIESGGAGGGGLEVGDIGISPFVDESKNLRRYLNGQIISQEQFARFTSRLKKAVETYPNLATTEADWQSIKSNSKIGQVGKFVIDDVAGTIRLPCIVKLQGMLDLSNIGNIVDDGLPTLTTNSTGAHTHTRGTMNITGTLGTFSSPDTADSSIGQNGAFNTSSTGRSSSSYYGTDFRPYKLQSTFDASKSWTGATSSDGAHSHTITGTSNTVQEEAVQYPYFIQVANGKIEIDTTTEIQLNNPFSLGDYKWSEVEIENLSWLKSDGGFKDGTVYPSYYDWILANANAGKELFKKSTDTYTDYDWVINTADNTFRLPTKTKTASGNAIVGNGMTLGLTDGTNEGGLCTSLNITYGLFANAGALGNAIGSGSTQDEFLPSTLVGITTDPTKSGIETSDNGLYLYFYVGETVKSVNIIDINALSNTKQDKATAVNYNNITNCITHIPQDIKLELNDGTLTLKAGSKVYVPNGFEADGTTPKFDVVVIESDLSKTTNTSENLFIFVKTDGSELDVLGVNNCKSGTRITPLTYSVNYMTDVNLCKLYTTNTSTADRNVSFPIAILQGSANGFTSIDQILNGFGYIGSTVFALPNVKGLIPNGRNADGSLKNIEFVTDKVLTETTNYSTRNDIFLNQSGITQVAVGIINYNDKENHNKDTDFISKFACIGQCGTSNGVISNFTPKLPFHALDRNDSSWLSGLGMPSGKSVDLTLGASDSKYTAPANGWFAFAKKAASAGQYLQMNHNSTGMRSRCDAAGATSLLSVYMPVSKGQQVLVVYTATGDTQTFRFIYAEGDK